MYVHAESDLIVAGFTTCGEFGHDVWWQWPDEHREILEDRLGLRYYMRSTWTDVDPIRLAERLRPLSEERQLEILGWSGDQILAWMVMDAIF